MQPTGGRREADVTRGGGAGASTVPTERSRKLRCPEEPLARPGRPLAMERAAPPRAARVAPSAVTADEGIPRLSRHDEGAAALDATWYGTRALRHCSTEHCGPAAAPGAVLAAGVSPRPPAGGSTQNASPRPFGGAGAGVPPLPTVSNRARRAPGERGQPDRPSPPRSACTNWPRRTRTTWRQTGGGISWRIGAAARRCTPTSARSPMPRQPTSTSSGASARRPSARTARGRPRRCRPLRTEVRTRLPTRTETSFGKKPSRCVSDGTPWSFLCPRQRSSGGSG